MYWIIQLDAAVVDVEVTILLEVLVMGTFMMLK